MTNDWETFNRALDKEKFYNAVKIQNELAAQGLPEKDIKLALHTTDIYSKQF